MPQAYENTNNQNEASGRMNILWRSHYLCGEIMLIAENDIYEHSDLHIWGVTTYVIHSFEKNTQKYRPR